MLPKARPLSVACGARSAWRPRRCAACRSWSATPHATSWIIGTDIGWNPVTNLNFDLELMYQSTTQTAPSGFLGTVLNTGAFVPGQWQGNSSGFAGRFRITRYF